MPAQWTAEIVSELHLKSITAKELAAEANIDYRYLSMILNGHRSPKNAEAKCRAALARLIAERTHERSN